MRIRSTAISQNVQKYTSCSGDTRIYDSTQIEVRTGGYYRSLHYIIKYHGYYLEIQGRTLFEEGWSEIDHDIVYPYYKDDEMLTEFSGLLNRLSGMADEMSSYFRKMKELREEEPDKNKGSLIKKLKIKSKRRSKYKKEIKYCKILFDK